MEKEREPMLAHFADCVVNRAGFGGPTIEAIYEEYRLLAESIVVKVPRSSERTVLLRKLLESRDCVARALCAEVA